MQGIDLHTHSNISDGALTPEDLVHKAVESGIHTLALTDHDSMDGLKRAEIVADEKQIRLISGVEISSQWSRPSTKKSYGVHIVGLNIKDRDRLEQVLVEQKQVRAQRAIEICHKLEKILKQDFYPDVLAKVDGVADRVTRSHIAQVLLEKRVVTRLQQAFDRFLKTGKPAFVSFEWLSLEKTIQAIQDAQGIAVLAHPTKYDLSATNTRYLIEIFAKYGGDAVELPPPSETASTRQMIDRLIAEHGLKVSIGSDFHGEHMPWLHLGRVPAVKEGQQGVWESFI
ncbi:hypothetical protein P256_01289 [Acinetobacter nectaris CIP 110549]|uniref:Polymerase/histidinol phosphatase N-terminal domain-containing protein n=1 Tax=Acinetobacter nectaris CIP 110549 TaxID=1392540 RepID=V2TAC4_9GAMM|nr:PHP domain-containing protein [Acinetobacter nectaris]ESK39608.1 hypothetical protein P256_01289 [Acinetobacter nectaris CIP 110549]